jgi:hypothetical protein
MFIATSSNYTESQFKYGVKVTASSTGQVLQFLVTPDVDGKLIFDLQSVVKLRNEDSTANWHGSPMSDYPIEPVGGAYEEYDVQLQEWWLIASVLTENVAAREDVNLIVFNASLQPSYGYAPPVDSVDERWSFAMASDTAQVLTDRVSTTHNWWKADSFPIGSVDAVYIPVLERDYGLLSITPTNRYTLNAPPYRARYIIFSSTGASSSYNLDTTEVDGIIHIPCYPMNINSDALITARPATTANWRYYTIQLFDNSTNASSIRYCFYNAEIWGQHDCRFDNVRLGWVNSRGGWDYFNFIKKNEWNNQIERKQYRRVLYRDSTEVFRAADRQLYDRENIVTRNLTITSDWVQEGEFIFLKNLLFSNQVQIIDIYGVATPVSIVDTAFNEKNERNGKKYNVTLNVTISQDYWL